jgi:MerR family transcriptional regulator, light-induced transcriptional regulator
MSASQAPPILQSTLPGNSEPEGDRPGTVQDDADEGEPRRQANLARMLELEIIPRLMLAHRTAPVGVNGIGDRPITPEDVVRFAKIVLLEDEQAAAGALEALKVRDVPVERLLLDLVAPTARYLGELWEQDLCSFTEVTVGVGRLQRMMHELAPSLGQTARKPADPQRILLLPCPGEQHNLGIGMLHAFFMRAGWDVTGGAWADGSEAPAWSASEWFDVVAFSLGSEVRLGALTDVIAKLRQSSRNRDLIILVGGAHFNAQPEWVARVGADGTSPDARGAPAIAEALVQAVARTQVSND